MVDTIQVLLATLAVSLLAATLVMASMFIAAFMFVLLLGGMVMMIVTLITGNDNFLSWHWC